MLQKLILNNGSIQYLDTDSIIYITNEGRVYYSDKSANISNNVNNLNITKKVKLSFGVANINYILGFSTDKLIFTNGSEVSITADDFKTLVKKFNQTSIDLLDYTMVKENVVSVDVNSRTVNDEIVLPEPQPQPEPEPEPTPTDYVTFLINGNPVTFNRSIEYETANVGWMVIEKVIHDLYGWQYSGETIIVYDSRFTDIGELSITLPDDYEGINLQVNGSINRFTFNASRGNFFLTDGNMYASTIRLTSGKTYEKVETPVGQMWQEVYEPQPEPEPDEPLFTYAFDEVNEYKVMADGTGAGSYFQGINETEDAIYVEITPAILNQYLCIMQAKKPVYFRCMDWGWSDNSYFYLCNYTSSGPDIYFESTEDGQSKYWQNIRCGRQIRPTYYTELNGWG